MLEHVHAEDDVVLLVGGRGLDVGLPECELDVLARGAERRELQRRRVEIGERDFEACLRQHQRVEADPAAEIEDVLRVKRADLIDERDVAVVLR